MTKIVIITDCKSECGHHKCEPTEGMKEYIEKYGKHFNEKLCNFAISNMKSLIPSTGRVIESNHIAKEELDELLRKYNVTISNNELWDYVYVANMCKADFYGSSISDEYHLCLYVKDVIDDADAYEGLVLTRWYADMCENEKEIDWLEMID